MINNEAKSELFTGLILLTSEDRPGIASELFKALSPFSVSVIDMGQIVIRERLILTVLISLNPDHQLAIESDLAICATDYQVDIATAFSRNSNSHLLSDAINLILISDKLHPSSLALIMEAMRGLGGNIESIQRQAGLVNSYSIMVSGVEETILRDAINLLKLESATMVRIGK